MNTDPRPRPIARRSLRLAVVLGLLFAAVVTNAVTAPTSAPAQAADLSLFDPGNIIADAVFFDSQAMDANQVQAFLNAKGSGCQRGADGSACLKNYSVTTGNRTADQLCSGYQGATESAASVITRVARACGVSPRVLLVLLQKEQSLVTTTNPTANAYTKAAGYACPDNGAGCDPAYAGLMNQLYNAAKQYQRYRAYPDSYSYQAGYTENILYHPNTGCGRKSVYIANAATAGLYNYTPYVPNAAALRAGYGTGDSCSSYGNRNFFHWFTDWFGSTQSPGGTAILDKYTALGGAKSFLGPATGGIMCGLAGGGCRQNYQNGVIAWSSGTGAHFVKGSILGLWGSLGAEGGSLGYPTADETAVDGGTFNDFARGAIYWNPTAGTHVVSGAVYDKWYWLGRQSGPVGWPTSDVSCTPSGCSAGFQNGSIHWNSSAGAHLLQGAVQERWSSLGGDRGTLGWPTSDMTCIPGGCYADFQNGSLYWSPDGGTRLVQGAIRDKWRSTGGAQGALGFPTADITCGVGGCASVFTGGAVLWSSGSGAHWMDRVLYAGFTTAGGMAAWGAPTSDQTSVSGGLRVGLGTDQYLYWSASTGAHVVGGAIYRTWYANGSQTGSLGFPVSDLRCPPGGCMVDFEHGSIPWSASTGAHVLLGDVARAWIDSGRGANGLGYPVSDVTCTAGACSADFVHGAITSTPTTGTHVISGAVYDRWVSAGRERGSLGFPTSDLTCVPGGCYADFANGSISWSPASGARSVTGEPFKAWQAQGREGGPLGFPTSDTTCSSRGCYVDFASGTISWSSSTGAQTVTGALFSAWAAAGREGGKLGLPTTSETCIPGGCHVAFTGGGEYWTPSTGVITVGSALQKSYLNAGGPGGSLGFPVAAPTTTSSGTTLKCSGGTLLLRSDGTVVVTPKP